jgi:3-oxoadipate enol-lactonase
MQLDYRVTGSGEPIVFIHGGIVADAFKPLIDCLDHSRFQAISYHRRGYGRSPRQTEPVSTEQQAADCLAVMRAAGIDRAHIAAYSYGGAIALQLALDAPGSVQSLALFEPLVASTLDEDVLRFFVETSGLAYGKYAAGDTADAMHTFAQGAFGPDYRKLLDAALPGAVDQTVSDADVMFQVELPAIQQWRFGPDEAARVRQPVLLVFHDEPAWGGFKQMHAGLRGWLPNVQASLELPPASTHLLQMVEPRRSADALMQFVTPIQASLAASR